MHPQQSQLGTRDHDLAIYSATVSEGNCHGHGKHKNGDRVVIGQYAMKFYYVR